MILVTGAGGFVGRSLIPYFTAQGRAVRIASRVPLASAIPGVQAVPVGDIGPATDWSRAIDGVAGVVHLAGLAHVLDRARSGDDAQYMRVNTEGTARLAEAAASAGVARFVFISSARVHGPARTGQVFSEADAPAPDDPYSRSKWAAEQRLREVAQRGGTAFAPVILRPPLVYGPGVGANFERLLRWAASGFPLPLAAIENRRSLVSVRNLCAAITVCLDHAQSPGNTFLVSDGEDVSTPALITRMGRALGTTPRLVAAPVSMLAVGARVVGRAADFNRLAADMAVDSRAIRRTLGFVPPQTLDAGLAEVAQWYREGRAA
jgi:nucleoside-diphosphate-sugar epimerase